MSASDVVRIEAVPLVSVGATLGEGPVWIERDRALWFVDIKDRRAYRYDPESRDLRSWEAPDQIGWLLPADDGGFVAGLASGLHRFVPQSGRFTPHAAIATEPAGNRLNDAALDPVGRLWFGSMDDGETAATGRLYAFEAGAVRDSGLAPVVITNGPAISPDGATLYAVDTLGRTVDAYPLGVDGRLGAGRRFLTIDPAHGWPDGAICDARGGVWLGFFGGWAARRYAADGTLTHEVRFPVANITKIAIGGPDGRTGYATTARKGLDRAALADQPHAGDLFTFPAPVAGVPVGEVRLTLSSSDDADRRHGGTT